MTTTQILEFVSAYVVLAALLLSLNAVSLWQWWVKIAAVVVTTAFFGGTYLFTIGLLGWPVPQEPPDRFSLLWSQIVEPNQTLGIQGAIYLWAEELDDTNRPKGPPRAYQLTYTQPLAVVVAGAQDKRKKGIQVMGTKNSGGKGTATQDDEAAKGKPSLGQTNPNAVPSSNTDTVAFGDLEAALHFEDLPPPELPDKVPDF